MTAPPETQFGPLLAAGLDLRPTTYFTTVRTPETVRESVARVTTDPDLRGIEHLGGDSGAARIVDSLDDLTGEADIVVDVMDPIEGATGQSEYVDFLNAVSRWCSETGGWPSCTVWTPARTPTTGSSPSPSGGAVLEGRVFRGVGQFRPVFLDLEDGPFHPEGTQPAPGFAVLFEERGTRPCPAVPLSRRV